MSGDGAVGAQAHLEATTASPAQYVLVRKDLKQASDDLILDMMHNMPQEWMVALFQMLTQLRGMNLYGAEYRAELTKTCQTFAYYFTLRMTDESTDYKLQNVEWPEPPSRWSCE